jgi:hypothetical protein
MFTCGMAIYQITSQFSLIEKKPTIFCHLHPLEGHKNATAEKEWTHLRRKVDPLGSCMI